MEGFPWEHADLLAYDEDGSEVLWSSEIQAQLVFTDSPRILEVNEEGGGGG